MGANRRGDGGLYREGYRAFCRRQMLVVVSRALAVSSLALALPIALVGFGPSPKAGPKLIEQIRQEVAKILKKDTGQIDVRKPLGAQGADELDIIEILMRVEEAFNVEIPDGAGGVEPDEFAALTVQKLADVVAGLLQKQKR